MHVEPTREEVKHGEYKETHPSYGMIRFSRVSGGNENLYGSSIRHQNYIELNVYRGERIRNLNTDWYHSQPKPLIQLKLSANQFAELIANMNCGSGVPCTLEWVNGERMPDCPERHKRQEVQQELDADLKALGEKAAQLERRFDELLKPGTIKKSDVAELKSLVSAVITEIRHNIPFAHECFDEACDKTVTEAKAEIDAAFTNLVVRMGLDRLGERMAEFVGIDRAPEPITLEHKNGIARENDS